MSELSKETLTAQAKGGFSGHRFFRCRHVLSFSGRRESCRRQLRVSHRGSRRFTIPCIRRNFPWIPSTVRSVSLIESTSLGASEAKSRTVRRTAVSKISMGYRSSMHQNTNSSSGRLRNRLSTVLRISGGVDMNSTFCARKIDLGSRLVNGIRNWKR